MLEYLKTLLERRRILEINGKFIPQIFKFGGWFGIPYELTKSLTVWSELKYQLKYCAVATFDQAKENYHNYIQAKEEDKKVIKKKRKVHEIGEPYPEFWKILKKP